MQLIINDIVQKNFGTPEIQIENLSVKISSLSQHLQINKKDKHSKNGLIKILNRRKKLLKYLKKSKKERYKKLLKNISNKNQE